MAFAVCSAAESPASRLLRRSGSSLGLVASGLLVFVAASGILPASSQTHRVANLLFVLMALTLLGCCVVACRHAARLRLATSLAGFATLAPLGFSDLGRGTAGFPATAQVARLICSLVRYLQPCSLRLRSR